MSDALMTDPPMDTRSGASGKWRGLLREETAGLPLRLLLANAAGRLLPTGAGGRLRAALYRRLGLRIGRGTIIYGPLTFGPARRFHRHVSIGARCFLNSPVYIDASAPVTLGDGVSLGHHVLIITTGHAIGPPEFRAGVLRTAPVTVEDGAWVAAGVTLLPGVTVGRGAVVAAGAVVTKDVPPHTLAGGVPARVIRTIEPEHAASMQ